MAATSAQSAAYWRRIAIRRKKISLYESGKRLTVCERETLEQLWRGILDGLRMADRHLRDCEPLDARFLVLQCLERAEELKLRGEQLMLQLLDDAAPVDDSLLREWDGVPNLSGDLGQPPQEREDL